MRDTILEGMATIFWGSAWADHAEEHRCYNLSGCEITQHMPPIPDMVRAFAEEVATEIEKASGHTLPELFEAAKAADNTVDDDDAERFGNCLAYQYVGAGVSWEDDHEKIPGLVMPHGEDYEIRIHADEACKEVTGKRQCPYCGVYAEIGERKCPEWHVLFWYEVTPAGINADITGGGDVHVLHVPAQFMVYRDKLMQARRWRGQKHAKAVRRLVRRLRLAVGS